MKRVLIALLALTLLAGFAACGGKTASSGEEVTFQLTVVFPNGTEKAHTVTTTKDNVGDALLEAALVQGETSQFGLKVLTVDGVTADYDRDQSWWQFTINGEQAPAGVSGTAIVPGDAYALVYTIG